MSREVRFLPLPYTHKLPFYHYSLHTTTHNYTQAGLKKTKKIRKNYFLGGKIRIVISHCKLFTTGYTHISTHNYTHFYTQIIFNP